MAKSKKITTVAIANITEVKPSELSEFQGWKEKQIQLVQENPLVSIEDHKTFELAKKHRTALKSGRTELQKQDKEIAKKLAHFRKEVGFATEDLINITLDAEVNQQTEIDRWEKKKAEEKAEADRIKAEEFAKLEAKVKEQLSKAQEFIDNMIYDKIDDYRSDFDQWCEDLPMEFFNDPALLMNERLATLDQKFEDKIDEVEKAHAEKLRLEELAKAEAKLKADQEKIAEQKAEAKRIEKENAEKEKEMIRKGKLLDCKILQQDQVEYLISAGYIQTDKNVWKQDGDMISVAILNEDTDPFLGFRTMDELREYVQNEEKLRADRIEAKKKAEAEALAKTEKAQEKIDNAVAEVKMDELKKETIQEFTGVEEIEVVDEFIFPQDLGVESDLRHIEHKINNMETKINLVLSDQDYKTESIKQIQLNLQNDLLHVISNYTDIIGKIRNAKVTAE